MPAGRTQWTVGETENIREVIFSVDLFCECGLNKKRYAKNGNLKFHPGPCTENLINYDMTKIMTGQVIIANLH